MFIPTTKSEITNLGWDSCDVILITGDVYIDSPYDGSAIIGKWLMNQGYRVGVISQPDTSSYLDIMRLGSPNLFWGVSAGCVDSMVANYTATKKRRQMDDLTPGGENKRRPDRAVMKYVNLIKQYFKNGKPIVIGGIEASLRRIAHYDFWDDSIRRSILFDSKADYLLYGMAEQSVLELAKAIKEDGNIKNIHGLCYISNAPVNDYIVLPDFELVSNDKDAFTQMFHTFYKNTDPIISKGLVQKTGDRYLIQNPPPPYPTPAELDSYYDLEFEYDAHPYYKSQGKIVALDTIKQSVTSHRGCFGECNFCAIAVHQGRKVISRTEDSIVNEVKRIAKTPKFNGIIYDVGGPSANMYGMTCDKQNKSGSCTEKRCAYPKLCKMMDVNHDRYTALLKRVRKIDGVNRVFVSSGLRYDLIMERNSAGKTFMEQLVEHHVSGQLKIAPEHISQRTLKAMGKTPDNTHLIDFKYYFDKMSAQFGKKQFLTYYFIAAHPECTNSEMIELKNYVNNDLQANPEQVQVFTPTPSTYSTLMYYTGKSPFTGEPIFVDRTITGKQRQKGVITEKGPRMGKMPYQKKGKRK